MDRSLRLTHEEIQAVRNNERKIAKLIKMMMTMTTMMINIKKKTTFLFLLLPSSQGAGLVHKIAALACYDDVNDDDCWKDVQKCILVSGFSFTTSIGKTMKTTTNVVTNGSSSSNNNRINCNDGSILDYGDDEDDKKATHTTINIIPSLHALGNKDYRVRPYLTRKVYMEEPCFWLW
ncbi:MAG: hypothetical protein ACI8RD_012278 [Bacillariaceae sp.]|jgi:hypothetical protein